MAIYYYQYTIEIEQGFLSLHYNICIAPSHVNDITSCIGDVGEPFQDFLTSSPIKYCWIKSKQYLPLSCFQFIQIHIHVISFWPSATRRHTTWSCGLG